MSVSVRLIRPDDLLVMRIVGVNLVLDATREPPALVRERPSEDAVLVVELPPQAIAEVAWPDGDPHLPAPAPPMDARTAGRSRLAFRVPDAVESIEYTVAALLDWSALEPVVVPVAAVPPGELPGDRPEIAEPGESETAIELPYRLTLSPGPDATWQHAPTPVTRRGRTELWHTRLARRTPQGSAEATPQEPIPLRAVWSPDWMGAGAPPPPEGHGGSLQGTSMTPRDRHEVVALSSAFDGYGFPIDSGWEPWVPQPIAAHRLMLSALGGFLSSRGVWEVVQHGGVLRATDGSGVAIGLSEWRHEATLGRDHYVRIVREGRVFPFGHRAAFVTVSERRFETSEALDGAPVAFLRSYGYVVIREPVRTIADAAYPGAGREMPFRRELRIATLSSPRFPPPPADVPHAPGCFWIPGGSVPGSLFPFHVVARDEAADAVELSTPLIFVPSDLRPRLIRNVLADYRADDDRRACPVDGRGVAFAPAAEPGDTSLDTRRLLFGAHLSGARDFEPLLDAASVSIPAVASLGGGTGEAEIKPYAAYVANGFDGAAEVWAELVGAPAPLALRADQAGGIATPAMAVTGLGRALGTVAGDLGKAALGTVVPADLFAGFDARLFGAVKLADLIPAPSAGGGPNLGDAPKLVTTTSPDGTITTRMTWRPTVSDNALVRFLPTDPAHPNAPRRSLLLDATIVASASGGGTGSYDMHGRLERFELSLLGMLTVAFEQLDFRATTGGKLAVKVDLATPEPLRFDGALSFVKDLAALVPAGLFGDDGPHLDLAPEHVAIGYSLGLPTVNVGVLALRNITLGASVTLPFADGNPTVDVAFATRQDPFVLTVELLGGGGFVHAVLDANGIVTIEGALEFGGDFSIDLGVASGGVHCMAGMCFRLEQVDGATKTTLTGFVDLGGEVSVLGIVSVSIEFNLSLTWQDPNKVTGRATLVVSVSVFCFSKSFTLSVERSYSNDGSDPTVAQVLPPAAWAEYAGAFA